MANAQLNNTVCFLFWRSAFWADSLFWNFTNPNPFQQPYFTSLTPSASVLINGHTTKSCLRFLLSPPLITVSTWRTTLVKVVMNCTLVSEARPLVSHYTSMYFRTPVPGTPFKCLEHRVGERSKVTSTFSSSQILQSFVFCMYFRCE